MASKTGRKSKNPTASELVVRQMPALRHSRPDGPFDIRDSEVVQWMIEQPAVLQAIFNHYNYRKAMVFRDGRWIGADRDSSKH